MFDNSRPIFLQLADRIADDILGGRYAEGDQVPSTNELSAHLRINPATAGKALTVLVEREILVKRRGIGMFVADGAKASIAQERTQGFVHDFVFPLQAEARVLGLEVREVIRLIESTFATEAKAEAEAKATATDSPTERDSHTERSTS